MPTPVSALIHAATMVTAGVYLLLRVSPILEFCSTALVAIATIGAFTAFIAATIGLVQNDLKRVIAYSTCSQLGYPLKQYNVFNKLYLKTTKRCFSSKVNNSESTFNDLLKAEKDVIKNIVRKNIY